jgi:hypothetical protein
MNRKVLGMIAAAALLLACPAVEAADYSRMNTAELAALRGTIENAPEEERRAFQEEWQRRVRKMTTVERRQYLGPPAETPAGSAPGQGEERRPEEVPPPWAPAYGRDAETGRPPEVQRGRERLLVPPASVAPRRYGEERQERRQQPGARPLAPTPDFDGRGPAAGSRDRGR